MKGQGMKLWFRENFPTFRDWRRDVRHLFKRPGWFFQRNILKNSIFISDFELPEASLLPQKTLEKVIEMFKPRSVLDLGSGTGRALDYFHSRGISVLGVEGSALAITRARHPDLMMCFNLEKELDLKRKFDLIWSYEFVEHIHPRHVTAMLRTFANHSDRVVLSAARPGQGGDGHFNEQPASYWIEKFRGYGYRYDSAGTETLRSIKECYNDNILVFER